jgi:hypothetical protein
MPAFPGRHGPGSPRRWNHLWPAFSVIAVAVGIPCLLITTQASPSISALGGVLAHPRRIAHLMSARVDDKTTIDVLAVVGYLVWAWFMACVVLELVARVRGRTAIRLPGSRRIQPVVACMVSACLAIGAPARELSVSKLRGADPFLRTPPSWALTESPSSHPVDARAADISNTAGPSSRPGMPAARSHRVVPGETLWSVAETELGAPLRWREIAEANYGLQQGDGACLTREHWIRPGWLLRLPAVTALPTVREDEQVELFSVVTSDSISTPTARAVPHHPMRDVRGGPQIPVAPVGYGILGAGIVMLLERMRRTQQRLRPSGLRIALPTGDIAELERGLRVDFCRQ